MDLLAGPAFRSGVIVLCGLFVFTVLGCSGKPAVEKELLAPAPKPAAKAPPSPDAGLVGSSHQQETAIDQAKKTASAPDSSESAATASDPSGDEVPTPEGYRLTHVSAQGGAVSIDFQIPEEWEERQPGSSMRLLQLALPGEAGEGELMVFYFGPSAGTIQMNIDRWIGQFTQPDGSSSKEKAKIEDAKGDHHSYTMLDLSGTMAASAMMGAPESPQRPGWRMLAGIVTTPAGPWFIKATGPEATMANWREAFVKVNRTAKAGAVGAGSGAMR